jgi:PPOX class probable F420-dependent enzyme
MTVVERETRARSLGVPGKYLGLTTYRSDGSPVSTPVWFVEEDGRLFVITGADSYKARRLRRNPACMVGPCTARGVPTGDAVPAEAEFLEADDRAHVDELMAAKYRTDRILILPVYRLVMRLRGTPVSGAESAYLVIRPT